MRRLLLGGLAVVLAACTSSARVDVAPVPPAAGQPINVITTAYPLWEAVSQAGGGRVQVTNLLPVSALKNEPLTQQQLQELREADLVVDLGKGTQPNVDQALAGSSVPRLSVLDGIDTKAPVAGNGTADPYVWTDPTLMARIVEEVQQKLAAMDPPRAERYEAQAAGYRSVLAAIDRDYAHTLAGCERKALVTEAPSFSYMADRFGLNQVLTAAVEPAAPTLKGVQPLEAVLRTYEPTTVFAAALPTSRAARALYERDGVRVSVLDSLVDRTDQARRGGATYRSVMALNLDALKEGLGCTEAFGGK